MNLKALLTDMGDHLVAAEVLSPAVVPYRFGDEPRTPKDVAKCTWHNAFVLTAFVEWVNRLPEAQEFLAERGFEWPVVAARPQTTQSEAVSGPPPVPPGAVSYARRPDGSPGIDLKFLDAEPETFSMSVKEQVRVDFGTGGYRPAWVTGVVGAGMLRLEAAGPDVRIRLGKLSDVHPDDRELAEAVAGRIRAAAGGGREAAATGAE